MKYRARKLTPEQVAEIRDTWLTRSMYEMVKYYNVPHNVIEDLINKLAEEAKERRRAYLEKVNRPSGINQGSVFENDGYHPDNLTGEELNIFWTGPKYSLNDERG